MDFHMSVEMRFMQKCLAAFGASELPISSMYFQVNLHIALVRERFFTFGTSKRLLSGVDFFYVGLILIDVKMFVCIQHKPTVSQQCHCGISNELPNHLGV